MKSSEQLGILHIVLSLIFLTGVFFCFLFVFIVFISTKVSWRTHISVDTSVTNPTEIGIGNIVFLQVHWLLLHSPLQLPDTNFTRCYGAISSSVQIAMITLSQSSHPKSVTNGIVVSAKLAECQIRRGTQARFICCRKAPGDGGSLLVSDLCFLYR